MMSCRSTQSFADPLDPPHPDSPVPRPIPNMIVEQPLIKDLKEVIQDGYIIPKTGGLVCVDQQKLDN